MTGKNFHNTLNLQGQLLFSFEETAKKQRDIIMDYMEQNPDERYTPIRLQEHLEDHGKKILLTSVRKHLSNMTRDGELHMHNEKVTEKYGAENHTWQFKCRKHRPRKAA